MRKTLRNAVLAGLVAGSGLVAVGASPAAATHSEPIVEPPEPCVPGARPGWPPGVILVCHDPDGGGITP
jgi:hypothetical protein